MPEGRIVKAISGFFYVRTPETDVQCRARGIFKKRKTSLLVGDRVTYEATENGEGWVTKIHPRTTELIRPPIANVEQAIVIGSLAEPELSFDLLDRFLIHGEREGLQLCICLTKADLVLDASEIHRIYSIYDASGYPIILTSVKTKQGIEELNEVLAGKVSVFAGQSGVGKSSLLNALLPEVDLTTGIVSPKLGRGRHTTRQVELLEVPGGGQVADTPGFSQLSFEGFSDTILSECFPEMALRAPLCKFRGCLHHNEPQCAVRTACVHGEIDEGRYQRYIHFLTEIQDQRRY